MATILIEQNQCQSIRIVDCSTNWNTQESQNFWGCLQKRGNKYKPLSRVGTKTVSTLPGLTRFYSRYAAPSTAAFGEISPQGSGRDAARFRRGRSPFRKPSAKARSAGDKRHSGVFSFGYLSLDKQRKVSRLPVREPALNKASR